MAAEYNKKKTLVIGHRNPDTDSVCSAVCYAALKRKLTGDDYEAARVGHMNEETLFVLRYFGVEKPARVRHVRTEVRDIDIRQVPGVNRNISLKNAWNIMQKDSLVTLPAVTEDGTLEGLITVSDIARTYLDVLDSSILSKANTKYSNIIETLEGLLIVGDENACFSQGKVLIAAANPDMMEYYISEHDLVILGNRYESQLCAIEMGADCIIVCEGAAVSMTIKKLAEEKGCTVMTTPYDAFTAARLINQSMPIGYFMKCDHLITFQETDVVDEIKDVMASKRHRDFPILDEDGKYKGMISRRNLLGAHGKSVILVDHNEKSQAVDGIENAHIVEIIDHHRLGSIETIGPVYFRNQPLGCTATIIYQMYRENDIAIDKQTAGLLCSAILSDTLLFRSPTCTEIDRQAAEELAQIAGIDVEKYAMEMFAAGSNFASKSEEDIMYQDFKLFTVGKTTFGVGQINSLNGQELDELETRMLPYLKTERSRRGLDMMFLMLTNILTESTVLLCDGPGAGRMIQNAFQMEEDDRLNRVLLSGVVSRKKQLIPAIMVELEG